jgi:ubiquinol-cytochrome c reductase cytochrome b subunit
MHNLADRPRDAPNRTAFGVAFLSFVFLVFAFGAADRIYVLIGLTYNVQLFIFRVAVFVVPVLLFWLTRRICLNLQGADEVEEINEEAEEEARAREQALAGAGGAA